MSGAVFLDRDGTMVHDAGYLSRLGDLRWYAWTLDAIRLLNRAGFLVFVTTNQGGIGLGLFPESFVHLVHEHMAATITAAGGRVDGWFYCPHHPRAIVEPLGVACDCRKPEAGMVRQAQQKFDIDLAQSFVVGDRASDLGMGARVRARAILVRTGEGAAEVQRLGGVTGAAYVAENLMEATSWILATSGHSRP